jgi:putative thioredoxin
MVDVTNFEEQVLAASHEKPVLVDFWAPWCGPCRQLGPILERIAFEKQDEITLAKLNTDEDQMTAMKYSIRSIPAVKLFVDGEVVDEFLGALPEPQVRQWLDGALPSEARQTLQEALAQADAGDVERAAALAEQVLTAEPSNADAALLLARLVVFNDPKRATGLARIASQGGAAYDLTQSIEEVARLLTHPGELEGLPEDPARAPYLEAIAKLSRRDVEGALQQLVASVRLNRHYHDDAARKTCLALFNVLGSKNPLTQKQRRSLEQALF